MISGVLKSTTPTTTAAGEPSKAKYVLTDDARSGSLAEAERLLSMRPLYPGFEL